jgi:hypothetical protein
LRWQASFSSFSLRAVVSPQNGDRLLDRAIGALILGSKALDVLVELGASVGMEVIATSGRSLGHAP